MFRLLVPFLVLALDVFAIVDVILTDRGRVRGVPKVVWVVIILFLPLLGVVLWFLVGKGRRPAESTRRVVAPDDDPVFLRNLRRDEEQDERIRLLEQQLAELDDDKPQD